METVSFLFRAAALLAATCAGLAWILGLGSIRDRMLRFSAWSFAAAVILVPIVRSLWMRVTGDLCASSASDVPITLPLAITLGHVVMGWLLLHRRFRDRERARRHATDLERARTRERPRLAELPEETE